MASKITLIKLDPSSGIHAIQFITNRHDFLQSCRKADLLEDTLKPRNEYK